MSTAQTAAAASLRDTAYPAWLVADTASALSAGVQSFAMPLLTLMITGSPALAGMVAALTVLARIAADLIGGVLADRHDRARLIALGAAIGCCLALGLVALSWTGSLVASTVIIATLVLAFSSALFAMVREPMLRDLLPAELVGRAQASNQARDAALNLATGPLGGLLLGIGGWLVGLVMATCDAVAAIAALFLRRRTARKDAVTPSPRERRSARLELREAFVWLVRRRDLLALLVIVTTINLGISITMTTTIYALVQQGTTAQVIGLVSAAIGAGMVIGAIAARWTVRHVPGGIITVMALTVTTVAMACLVALAQPVGVAAALFAVGLVMPAVNATLGGYMMLATPADMLGRVGAASSALSGVVSPLAPLVAGLGLAGLGRVGTIVIGIALMLAAVVLTVLSRPVRTIPTDTRWQDHADAYAN